jgi:hypothetical protein
VARVLGYSALARAAAAGGCVDGSGPVLGDGPLLLSRRGDHLHRPAILISGKAFRTYVAPERGADTVERDALVGGERLLREVKRFELLSLAARVLMIASGDAGSRAREDGKAVVASLAETLKGLGVKHQGMIEIAAGDVLRVLADLEKRLGPHWANDANSSDSRFAAGLQLIGVKIVADARTKALDLTNRTLPFSLKLIGCIIDCPLLLQNCRLASLDLSGSAIAALEATSLKTQGSVLLRRTFVMRPVSFANAKIEGSFNASDVAIAPFARVSPDIAVDPDNGVLNLSRAEVDSDVRLSRARIWGGLSVRGLHVGRSLFLQEAVLVSPLGMVEKNLATENDSQLDFLGRRLADADRAVAEGLFAPACDPSHINLEILNGLTHRWKSLAKRTMPLMQHRGIITAFRADHLRVGGTVSADRLICNGKWRMKYARIEGGIRLQGALIRAPADIYRQACVRKVIRQASPDWRDEIHDEVAIDLRQSMCKGDLSLSGDPTHGKGLEQGHSLATVELRHKDGNADIIGRLDLQSFRTHGGVLLSRVAWKRCREEPVAQQDGPRTVLFAPSRAPFLLTLDALFRRGPSTDWLASKRLAAVVRAFLDWKPTRVLQPLVQTAWRRFAFPSDATPADFHAQASWEGEVRSVRGRRPSVDMSQADVGLDLDLRACINLDGISLENATIGGDLRMSHMAKAMEKLQHPARILCQARARDVRGVLDLRALSVAGDAFLVFDPQHGPEIDASMMTVTGHFAVYPQVGAEGHQLTDAARRDRGDSSRLTPRDLTHWTENGFRLDQCSHETVRTQSAELRFGRRGVYCDSCHAMVDKRDDDLAWTINLRHARATIFSHPPAAWPDPGGLRLDGFRYQQSTDLGPLAPITPLMEDREVAGEAQRLRYAWRQQAPRGFRAEQSLFMLTMLGVIIAGLALAITHLAGAAIDAWGLGWGVVGVLSPLLGAIIMDRAARGSPGGAITLLLGAVGFLWLAIALSGLGPLAPAWNILAVCSGLFALFLVVNLASALNPGGGVFVRNRASNPLALAYLERQKMPENRFKFRPSRFPILESYARAAQALRESGRYLSANRVEEERLRKRTQMLSWRLDAAAKLLLSMVDVFVGYGFRLSRAVLILAAILCLVAVTAHWAAATRYLRPEPALTATEIKAMTACGSGDVVKARCPDFVYAADLLLPFIDLGEQGRWKAVVPSEQEVGIRRLREPWRSLWVSLLLSWPALVNAVGLVLTAVMATALVARVESALSKVQE